MTSARNSTGDKASVGLASARKRIAWFLLAGWVLFPTALAAATYPRWWDWIAQEQTPMTWLQSVVLVLASAGSLLTAFVCRRTGHGSRLAWLLLAVGFAGLAFDERFAVHERVRDGYLAPRGVTIPFLPWVAPGDFLIMILAAVGLLALPLVWRAVRADRWALRALVLGVLLALGAVAMDSIDPATWSVPAERVQQSLEEVVELGSGLALMAAILFRLLGILDTHLVAGPAPSSERPVSAEPSAPSEAARPEAAADGSMEADRPSADGESHDDATRVPATRPSRSADVTR